ncbi:MAG: tRNA (adenosine(37)-N6)-threonylcarbamoyltransferase complex ATPase subunit type 1 TsaE [Firmicutes bacterium]|nr:tRNA (adenosine(37)-N6)-threonylcarbamoyltransferase complex ATPase subunit type 1 TsaE [Bacillota bacterium]
MLSFSSKDPQETKNIGAKIGKLLLPADFLNLNGQLGAGKTLLVKGIGLSLGIPEEEIVSPTFVLINEYIGLYPLYHFDLYRLEEDYELEQIGYADYFYGSGITAVEWGDLFAHYLPEDRLDITLNILEDEKREIRLKPNGERSGEIVKRLRGQG